MCLASRRTRPSARVLATRSDPARSTRFSLDLCGGVRGQRPRHYDELAINT